MALNLFRLSAQLKREAKAQGKNAGPHKDEKLGESHRHGQRLGETKRPKNNHDDKSTGPRSHTQENKVEDNGTDHGGHAKKRACSPYNTFVKEHWAEILAQAQASSSQSSTFKMAATLWQNSAERQAFLEGKRATADKLKKETAEKGCRASGTSPC